MVNFNKLSHRKRLFDAIETSRKALAPFRETRTELIKKHSGDIYGKQNFRVDDNQEKRTYLNLMNQTADTYTMSMAANNPQVMVETRVKELRGFALHYQIAINNQLNDMRFSETLRDIVMDAFFGVGIAKVFMAPDGEKEITDEVWMDPGKPFVEQISLDDFFFDSQAKKWSQIRFCGNRYRIPFEDLKDERFDQDVVKYAETSMNPELTEMGEERASSISNQDGSNQDDFEEMVDLIDVWFPREGMIRTFLEGKEQLPPLAEVEWDGPEGGPYYILSFVGVPDQIMPVAPSYNIVHLHELMNMMLRKFSKQVGRQKDITVVDNGSVDDGETIKSADDGDIVTVTDPKAVGQLKFGGVDQSSLGFSIQVMDLFKRASGNIEAMAGLGPSAGTVGQEEMIQSAVSDREAQMQTRVLEFVEKICKVIGYMLWADEFNSTPGEYKLPGTDITIPADWEPGYREGDFIDYNFSVTPHSMTYQSPSQRLASLNQVVTQVVLPMMDVIAQQGGTFDFQEYLRTVSRLTNNPGIDQMVQFQNPPMIPEPGMKGFEEGGSRKPANTTREYVRRSVSTGGTEDNRRHTQMQSLMGGNQNNQDQNAMAMSYS